MEKPRRDGDDCALRRKKYKAYLDNSDGPAVVVQKRLNDVNFVCIRLVEYYIL